jgi:hypothetical protein
MHILIGFPGPNLCKGGLAEVADRKVVEETGHEIASR